MIEVKEELINANYLALDERMFLIWALNRPADYKFHTERMSKELNIGTNKIVRFSFRLKQYGHLKIERHASGKTTWHFTDKKGGFSNVN